MANQNDVAIPLKLYRFLMGEGPIEGTWFGELDSGLGHRGRFWWRALLLTCARAQGIEAAPAAETVKLGSVHESRVAATGGDAPNASSSSPPPRGRKMTSDADEKRRFATAAWWERQTIREFIARKQASLIKGGSR